MLWRLRFGLAATTGSLRVKLQDFPALQTESGSVRIAINPVNGNQSPSGTFYPVIINRVRTTYFIRSVHGACIKPASWKRSTRRPT